MNQFHDLTIGRKAPKVINVVVEIPKGSHNKYELDEELGVFKLDRVLYSSVRFPLDYGFVPETRSLDGDHLDAFIIGSDPVFSGCLVEARPVGLILMIDSGEEDNKIIAVQDKNPRFKEINNLEDIEKYNPHLIKEVTHFLETYKALQGKEVKVVGWKNRETAEEEIGKTQELYRK